MRVNPICSASRMRSLACGTPRTSPPRPTSPNTAVPCAMGRLRTLDATAATIAEIGRRLVDAHPAGDVDEHIVGDQVQAGALFEHRQQQRQAVLIDADRHAPRLP